MEKNEQRKRYAGQTTMTTKQNPAQTHMELQNKHFTRKRRRQKKTKNHYIRW